MSIYDSILDMGPDIDELVLTVEEVDVEIGLAAKVILYNDEDHTFDEVIFQIMYATGCSEGEAEDLTGEVHFRGKAVVFEGAMDLCIRVSTKLEEIALHTQIEF